MRTHNKSRPCSMKNLSHLTWLWGKAKLEEAGMGALGQRDHPVVSVPLSQAQWTQWRPLQAERAFACGQFETSHLPSWAWRHHLTSTSLMRTRRTHFSWFFFFHSIFNVCSFMSGGNHNNLFHSCDCSLRLRRKLETQSRWNCSWRRPSLGTWLNEANWTAYIQMLTYWSLVVCVIDALYCDRPRCESVCMSLLIAVVHGDSCPCLQPLEKQRNQLLCERRAGFLRRHRLVCQHQRREYQQPEPVLMGLISRGQHVSLLVFHFQTKWNWTGHLLDVVSSTNLPSRSKYDHILSHNAE